MSRRRKIFIGVLAIAVLGVGGLWATGALWPYGSYLRRPPLAETPPLPPYTRNSVVTVPIAVALPAIRAALDEALPKSFSGKRENPILFPFGNTDIHWDIERREITLTGRPEELTMSATLAGTLRIVAQQTKEGTRAGAHAGAAGLFNIDVERAVQDFVTGAIEPRGEVRGDATLSARPSLLKSWRVDPILAGRVAIAEGGLSLAGFTIDISDEIKSAIDRAVNDKLGEIQSELRKDKRFEDIAKREWAKLCRSVALPAVASGVPNLWLEIRPIRAFASQPRIDAAAAMVTMGVEAATRITPRESRPDCPFPTELDLIPQLDKGRFDVAVPIEVPFDEVNRVLVQQLRGRTFPENPDASGRITVLRAQLFPSGQRLLMSLLVQAREQKTWLGLSARATVHISARPVLDLDQQILMLKDLEIDVQSPAGFGLFGAAARAAIPYFAQELEQNAVIDLKPYVSTARRGIETVIADFDRQDDTLSTTAAVTALRLIGVEFDAKTVRVIAEVEGTGKIDVAKLPKF